jgi:hypothetical protein
VPRSPRRTLSVAATPRSADSHRSGGAGGVSWS